MNWSKITVSISLLVSILIGSQTFDPSALPNKAFEFDPGTSPGKTLFVKYTVEKNTSVYDDFNLTSITGFHSIPLPDPTGTYISVEKIKPAKPLNITIDDKNGTWVFDRNVTMSDPAEMLKYVEEASPKLLQIASPINDNVKADKKIYEQDYMDTKNWTKEKLIEAARASGDNVTVDILESQEDLFNMFESQIKDNSRILCQISREVHHSYICPLPGMTYFTGGDANTAPSKAKADCDEKCIDKDIKCTAINTMTGLKADKEVSINKKLKDTKIDIVLSQDQELQKLELYFEFSDPKVDKLLDQNNTYIYLGYDMKRIEKVPSATEAYRSIQHNLAIKYKSFKKTIFINESYKQLSFNFKKLYAIDGMGQMMTEEEANLTKSSIKLTKYKITYSSKYHWFCPTTQLVTGYNACVGGTVKTAGGGIVIDGDTTAESPGSPDTIIRHICVPEQFSTYHRDRKTGGYLSEYMCNSACARKMPCEESFAHLNGSLSSTYLNPKVECAQDLGPNGSCTDSMCQKFFEDDKMPVTEIIWNKHNKAVYTVKDGTQIEGVNRPRLDYAGEMGAGNTLSDKKQLFINEMKDIAYKNMIKAKTFDVSFKPIKEETNSSSAYSANSSLLNTSFDWLLKPKSFDYDDSEFYLYSIIEVDIRYYPIAGMFHIANNIVVYGNDDPRNMLIDKVYLLKTGKNSNDWITIGQIEYDKGFFFNKAEKLHRWVDIKHERKERLRSFNTVTNKFNSVYGLHNNAPYFDKVKFDINKVYERYRLSDNVEATFESIPGVFFHNQTFQKGGVDIQKLYDVAFDEDKRAFVHSYRVYGVYSKIPKKYQELIDMINDKKNIIFDYMSSVNYRTKIKSDGALRSANVKMYIKGKPNKMTLQSEFIPEVDEMGKEAIIFMFLQDAKIE